MKGAAHLKERREGVGRVRVDDLERVVEAPGCVGGQPVLVRLDRPEADRFEVVDRGTEANRLGGEMFVTPQRKETADYIEGRYG